MVAALNLWEWINASVFSVGVFVVCAIGGYGAIARMCFMLPGRRVFTQAFSVGPRAG